MPHDQHLREKARSMRGQGYTLAQIMERLSLPKTTIYGWIADMPRPIRNYQTPAQLNGTAAMVAKYARLRDEAYKQGIAEAPTLLSNPAFRDFVTMYLCEGYRRGRNSISIANSNSAILKVAQKCLLSVADKSLRYTVQIHIDHNMDEIQAYWGQELSIDPAIIRLQRKSNSGQLKGRQFRSVHGVLTIWLDDTYVRARLQAWMDILQQEWLDFTRE